MDGAGDTRMVIQTTPSQEEKGHTRVYILMIKRRKGGQVTQN